MPHEPRRRIRQNDFTLAAVLIAGALVMAVTLGIFGDVFNHLVGAVIVKQP